MSLTFMVDDFGSGWRWRAESADGQSLFYSPGTYATRDGCLEAIDAVMTQIRGDVRVVEQTPSGVEGHVLVEYQAEGVHD